MVKRYSISYLPKTLINSVIYATVSIQETMTPQDAARIVVSFLIDENKKDYVQFTSQAGGFKILSSSMKPTENITEALALCTSSMSSTFKGMKNKIRTRFLDQNLLDASQISGLKALCDSFEEWALLAYAKLQSRDTEVGKKIYKLVDSDFR